MTDRKGKSKSNSNGFDAKGAKFNAEFRDDGWGGLFGAAGAGHEFVDGGLG